MRVERAEHDTPLSPFRIVDGAPPVLAALNRHLDRCAVRGLSPKTLQTYAYVLLHVGRWMEDRAVDLLALNANDFWDFIEHVRTHAAETMKRAASLNMAVTVLRGLCTTATGKDPLARRSTARFVRLTSDGPIDEEKGPPSIYMRPERHLSRPLRHDETMKFFAGLRTRRDLSVASLMLFSGLRIAEVVGLRLADLDLVQAKVFVRGKGAKDRVVPIDTKTIDVLLSYVTVERPATGEESVFLVLKGPRRGRPLTIAGLRTVFRHHRVTSTVSAANPHRFRHTFAVDMVKSGMSLPALQRILGHSYVTTTMRYLNLSPEHVREEFDRAVKTLLAEESDVRESSSDR